MCACVDAAANGKDCTSDIKKFNEIVAGWGRLVRAASVNLTGETVEEGSFGIDLARLRSQSCTLQITLAPFGEKGDPDEWALYEGGASAHGLEERGPER